MKKLPIKQRKTASPKRILLQKPFQLHKTLKPNPKKAIYSSLSHFTPCLHSSQDLLTGTLLGLAPLRRQPQPRHGAPRRARAALRRGGAGEAAARAVGAGEHHGLIWVPQGSKGPTDTKRHPNTKKQGVHPVEIRFLKGLGEASKLGGTGSNTIRSTNFRIIMDILKV